MPTRPPHLRRLRDALASVLGRMLEPEPVVGEPDADELLRCPACRDASMCPMDWEADGELAWWMRCRCGNCGVWVEAVVPNRQAAALDVALDRQLDVIRRAADVLELERMTVEADVFIAALQRGGIHPADFA